MDVGERKSSRISDQFVGAGGFLSPPPTRTRDEPDKDGAGAKFVVPPTGGVALDDDDDEKSKPPRRRGITVKVDVKHRRAAICYFFGFLFKFLYSKACTCQLDGESRMRLFFQVFDFDCFSVSR